MRHGDERRVLALSEDVPRLASDRLRVRGSRRRRCRARALDARVHVRLVVVADVQHVVVPLEHPGQAREADVERAPVASLRDDADVAPALCPQGGCDPARDGRCVPEQRVQPGELPRGLRVRRREDLEAARGVRGDEPALRRAHRRVEDVPGTERLAAALTGAVARRERVRPLVPRLDGSRVRVEQPVADREGPELVQLDALLGHPRLLSAIPPRRHRDPGGCSRRAAPTCGAHRCGRARGRAGRGSDRGT